MRGRWGGWLLFLPVSGFLRTCSEAAMRNMGPAFSRASVYGLGNVMPLLAGPCVMQPHPQFTLRWVKSNCASLQGQLPFLSSVTPRLATRRRPAASSVSYKVLYRDRSQLANAGDSQAQSQRRRLCQPQQRTLTSRKQRSRLCKHSSCFSTWGPIFRALRCVALSLWPWLCKTTTCDSLTGMALQSSTAWLLHVACLLEHA